MSGEGTASSGAQGRAPPVSIRISGGLGNQMFQYAAARALALRTGASLDLDLSFYDKGRHRGYELGAFPLAPHTVRAAPAAVPRARVALSRWWRRLRGDAFHEEAHFHYDPAVESLRPPVHLLGHFQSARYFAAVAATIRRELMPPAAADAVSQDVAAAIAAANDTAVACTGPSAQRPGSAALHVRRGDYVSNPKNAGVFAACGVEYYARALQALPEGSTVFVFSDDIAWAREHLPRLPHLPPLQFVGDGSPRAGLGDLWLMTLAHHHIIANSSLSWWGAWLAGPDQGLTVAPARWFVDPAKDTRDLIPADWRRV